MMAEHLRSSWHDQNATSIAIFTLVICSARMSLADQELWKNCSTPRTHYVLQVPGSLVQLTGDGITDCTYQSSDGEFNVEAAEQTDNQNLDARMQKEIDLLKGTVTDQKKGNNWFALTGVTSDGTEFYRLHYTNGAQWVTLRITYPRSKAKKYDKWVERIDKAFVAFSGTPESVGSGKENAGTTSKDRHPATQRTAEPTPPPTSPERTPLPQGED